MIQAPRPLLTVNLDALQRNWRNVRARFSGQDVGAVVKHDAYGLGLAQVVPTLAAAGCRHFWADTPLCGLAVKAALSDTEQEVQVLVLYGLIGMSMPDQAANGLIPVLTSLEEIAQVNRDARCNATQYKVAIHLDTGLTRLGLREPDVAALIRNPALLDGFHITDWVTQLSRFDAPMDPACVRQRHLFESWTAQLPPARRCVATSAGVFADRRLHFDHARVGGALYGIDTSPDSVQQLATVATLTAPVLQVVAVPPQTAIGYGSLYSTSRPSVIATIAAGYGDGLPVSLARGGHVFLQGHQAPVVGAVAMGLLNVDISDLPGGSVKLGDQAELYGPNLNLSTVAASAGLSQAAIFVPAAIKADRRYLPPQGLGGHVVSEVLA
jgi:alanine racemase